jgi:predicted flap endonuclease-1-like 5' DNA nuclease
VRCERRDATAAQRLRIEGKEEMSAFTCCVWWLVLGVLIGWVASWLLNRMTREPELVPLGPPLFPPLVPSERLGGGIGTPTDAAPSTRTARSSAEDMIPAAPAPAPNAPPSPTSAPRRTATPAAPDTLPLPNLAGASAAEEQREGGSIDYAAASAAGFSVKGPDDLAIIEGIGRRIAELLHANGVRTFADLAKMERTAVQDILDRGGPGFKLARPDTWMEQAGLAARNEWAELRALQDKLIGGNRRS